MSSLNPAAKLFICGLFCLLGFLGNWLKLELFFNVDFLGGSFFVMLAILTLGGVYGTIVGFAAATCTYFLWNHPWAVIIFTAEAVVTAALYSKRKGNPVIYDIAYWGCLGMPMVYLFYHHVMGIPLQPTLLVMLKQSINGVCNTLMALLAFIAIKFMKRSSGFRIAYPQLLFALMLSLVLLPSLTLFLIEMRYDQQKITASFEDKVALLSRTGRGILEGWIDEHHKSIQMLASLVGDPDSSSFEHLQHYVELVKASNPAFKKMGVIDKRATTVAYTPLMEDSKSTLGVNFSDRPYISIMKKEKKPYIPDVVMGKLGTPAPIVLLLAPIVVSDEYKGYCTGVLDPSQLSSLLANLGERDIQVSVVDGESRVIASTIPGLALMEKFPRPYGPAGDAVNAETRLWKPDPRPNASPMAQWRNSFLYNVARLTNGSRWNLIVEASCGPLTETLTQASLARLVFLSLLVASAALLAHVFSGGFLAGIVRLQTLTRLLPKRLDQAGDFVWPESSIWELDELSRNFRSMAFTLQEDSAARRQAEDALRDSLNEKTALLKEVHHRVKNNLQIVASLLGLQAGRSNSPEALEILQDTRNRVKSMALLHETLYRSENLGGINFSTYLRDLCGQLLASHGPATSRVQVEYRVAEVGLPLEQAVPCGLIANELVTNALKHGFPENRSGSIWVSLVSVDERTLVLSVADDGVGLPAGFDPTAASTLGMRLVAGLAHQLDGELEVDTARQTGAAFHVTFHTSEAKHGS